MKRFLILILALSQYETLNADSLVAPPGAAMQFEEAAPASPRPMKSQTVQPADVAPQQPLPQQQLANQPTVLPAQPVPNISSDQSSQQAMTLLQQFMQMLNGGGGQVPGSTPMYLPNGQLNPAWVESNRAQPNAPYYGRTGTPNYDRTFPGLEQSPMMNAEEAARRLKGHRCTPNDKDRLACMVCNLMYEAGNEPPEGQMAVVRSVMTRAFSAPYPDTVCKVVYQNNGRVAQYSWTFENKNHTLPNSSKVDDLIRIAMEGMKKGPNGLTNYFAWRLVNPEWGRTGECARTTTRIGGHQFCTINGRAERSVASYLRAEGLPSSSAPEQTSGAAR